MLTRLGLLHIYSVNLKLSISLKKLLFTYNYPLQSQTSLITPLTKKKKKKIALEKIKQTSTNQLSVKLSNTLQQQFPAYGFSMFRENVAFSCVLAF